MLRGTVLLLALLSATSPEEAVEHTWAALQDGSPREFLGTLTSETSSTILDACQEYLVILRGLSSEELGEVFASVRLEAAPDEVEHWDSISVLEMMMSAPQHHAILSGTGIAIDSVDARDSMAVVHVTVSPPGGNPEPIIIYAAQSPLGWRTGGLEPLAETVLERTITP